MMQVTCTSANLIWLPSAFPVTNRSVVLRVPDVAVSVTRSDTSIVVAVCPIALTESHEGALTSGGYPTSTPSPRNVARTF